MPQWNFSNQIIITLLFTECRMLLWQNFLLVLQLIVSFITFQKLSTLKRLQKCDADCRLLVLNEKIVCYSLRSNSHLTLSKFSWMNLCIFALKVLLINHLENIKEIHYLFLLTRPQLTTFTENWNKESISSRNTVVNA